MLTLCSHTSIHNVCRGRQHSGTRYPKVAFFVCFNIISLLHHLILGLFPYFNIFLDATFCVGSRYFAQVIFSFSYYQRLILFPSASVLQDFYIGLFSLCSGWSDLYGFMFNVRWFGWFMAHGVWYYPWKLYYSCYPIINSCLYSIFQTYVLLLRSQIWSSLSVHNKILYYYFVLYENTIFL